MKGLHEGPAFTPDQLTTVGDWITFFNANRAAGDGGDAQADDRAVHAVDDGDATRSTWRRSTRRSRGVKVTFTAKMVGTSIELTNIKVDRAGHHRRARRPSGLRDLGSEPEPDAGSGRQLLEPRRDGVLGLVGGARARARSCMPNFAAGDLLSVAFALAEPKMGSARRRHARPAARTWRCSSANVKPLLAANNCSTNCHVGARADGGPQVGHDAGRRAVRQWR